MTEPEEKLADLALEQGFGLGTLRVDPNAGEVAGPGGTEKLDPKVMAVLMMLAERARHVVPREELLARIWPNAVVTDDALTRCLYELRRQLSQAGGDEQLKAMIETVPKRGYRLNGTVTPPTPGTETRPLAASRWRIAAVGFAIVTATVLWISLAGRPDPDANRRAGGETTASIAVLPFVDMSAGQDQEYFSDGISEEILNRLTQVKTFLVIARTSSFAFKGQPASIQEIGQKLGVTHVLEGSVRRSGDRIRITTRLVEASSNSQLWSETYDRETGGLFSIQDEIATSVATALRSTLAGTATRGAAPASAKAYELFLQGEFFYNRRATGDVALAEKYYRDALAIDPGFARAWASLAGTYSLLAYEGAMPREVALEKQGEAARKAIELDPNLAVAHARYSQYHWDIGEPGTGYQIWDQALALDPDDPLVLNFTAGVAMRAGEVDKAVRAQRRLVARDPLSAGHRVNLGMYLQAVDQLDGAKTELQKALELNPDLGSGVDFAIARILVLTRQFKDAKAALARLPEGDMRDHVLALLAHAEGRPSEADAALGRLVARSTTTPDIRLAEVYAFRGMSEQAFDALQGLLDAIEWDEPSLVSQVWSWQVELRVSPFLRPLHRDPRWQALMAETRLS
ncbi:MAG: FlgO family outer membrane protein [Steroidobacteraceae bacterium]